MPHVTFSEIYPKRSSYEESRAIVAIPKKKEDDKSAIVLRRSRTISYKIPEEQPSRPPKPVDKTCIERKITYKDSKGNIIKITYENSYGKVTKTIYPALPPTPAPKECCPPSPPPQKFEPPPVSEPSKIPSDDVKNCDWTKIKVRNSRGVVWKIVHVDCHGKTMKTEYPEPDPPRRQYTETKRYLIKEIDSSPPRKRHSETKKVIVDKEVHSSPPRRRYSETKKVVVDQEVRQPTPKSSSETVKVEKNYQFQATVESDDESRLSKEPSESTLAPPPPAPSPPRQESVTDSTITNRRDSVTNSSGKTSAESTREVIKDENGVVKKVIYTDSKGRRRTVVYDDDD
ncbi:hypothetical protein MBLNU13_g00908t1 [Cladosporium sp. NU13]